MNAWGWSRPPGPEFGTAGEVLECPAQLDLLAATPCPDTGDALTRILAPAGHHLRLVQSGDEALHAFQSGPPDLVLLDEPLCPGGDCELARQLKLWLGARRWVPLLLLAETAPEQAACRRTGIDDWLPKPVEPAMLVSRLELLGKGLALQRRLMEMHRFQTLFDHVLEGIVATDGAGLIESFNPAAERIFGYRAAEVVGRNVSILMPLPDAHRHDAYMARYQASGEPTVMGRGREIFGKRKDGTLVPLYITLTQMEWLGRRHFVAVIQDISERKRQESRIAHYVSELEKFRERIDEERRIARELVERMTSRGTPDDPRLTWTVIPAETFSGDLLLAQRSPDGRLLVFAADAMGHGLPAAVSLLPVAGIFHAMAGKGLEPRLIANEMNQRLSELVPTGHFVAACLLALDENKRTLDIWTGGMPQPVLCLAGSPPQPLGRPQLPLGVARDAAPADAFERVSWSQPGHLVIYSDGLSQAVGPGNTGLDEAALRATIEEAAPANPFAAILQRLHSRLAGRSPEDDILLAVVELP